ncbi:MAG: Gfo/Idh/MocA family oxidoreductase [Candidatus Omnitrophica bacterium]|nr:Gfo/Idh/MocA family oxidoreductase [Candidatus Omnitrophota bacterium]
MTDPFKRREFLKTSIGTASLAVAGRAAEKSPLRFAVVGTGGRGSDLIRKLTTFREVEIGGVCDIYPPHLEKGIEYSEGAEGFKDFSEMLEKTQPRVVVIATPLHLHESMALEAIEFGAHLYCEKILAYSVDAARRIAEAAEKKGTILQVGLQKRANPIYDQAVSMVETGMLGQIAAIKCQWHRNHSWRRPLPVSEGDPYYEQLDRHLNWRLYKETSQGLMAELGSHQMDVVNRILGVPPKRVLATGGIDYWRDGREVCDNVFCVYEYEKKNDEGNPYTVRVTYSSLQSNAYEGASELVMGDKGTLFLTSKKALFYRENVGEEVLAESSKGSDSDAVIVTSGKTLGLSNDPWAHRGKPLEIDSESDESRDALYAFIRKVQKGDRKTICDANVGVENVATVLMANESIERGVTVEYPI